MYIDSHDTQVRDMNVVCEEAPRCSQFCACQHPFALVITSLGAAMDPGCILLSKDLTCKLSPRLAELEEYHEHSSISSVEVSKMIHDLQ